MDTILLVAIVYLMTVAASFPFIKWGLKEGDYQGIISNEFLAKVIAFLPVYNLVVGFLGFKRWVTLKMVQKALKKLSNRNPDVKPKLDEAVEGLNEITKLD